MLDKLSDIKILGISSYYYITFLFVISIYTVYDFVKKYKVRYLKVLLLVNIILFSIILYLLVKYDVKEDRIKSGCLSIILVCIFMMFRAKHDNRGKNVNAIINNKSMWRKMHVYFFPQEFNNEELKIIEEKVQKIFDILEGEKFEKKVGDLFIWIKKKRHKITIRLVNQLDYSCDDIAYDVINMYKDIEKSTSSILTVSGDKDAKIELILEF